MLEQRGFLATVHDFLDGQAPKVAPPSPPPSLSSSTWAVVPFPLHSIIRTLSRSSSRRPIQSLPSELLQVSFHAIQGKWSGSGSPCETSHRAGSEGGSVSLRILEDRTLATNVT